MLRQTKISLLACLLCSSIAVMAQLPQSNGERMRYDVNIEMPKGYISGICVMTYDEDKLKGAVVNEFGVTAMAFTYNERKDKVKLVNVIDMLDKWYIRRVLRSDLREVIHGLRNGNDTYINEKRKIKYQFTIQKFGQTN